MCREDFGQGEDAGSDHRLRCQNLQHCRKHTARARMQTWGKWKARRRGET